MGEEICACPRDKVIETYIGVRTLEERGVLMCSCVGVWGRERLLSVCGGGGDQGGGVLLNIPVMFGKNSQNSKRILSF